MRPSETPSRRSSNPGAGEPVFRSFNSNCHGCVHRDKVSRGASLTTGLVPSRSLRHYWKILGILALGTDFLKAAPGCHTHSPAGRSDGHLAGLARRAFAFRRLEGRASGQDNRAPTGNEQQNGGAARAPDFSRPDSDAFEQLCRYAKHGTLKRGAAIFSKGDPGNSLIAVISGTVKISISSPTAAARFST